MARSDKVPFRREFTLTSNGYAGDSEGFFVGDIMSLHLDFLDEKVSYELEGKVGATGEWVLLSSNVNVRHVKEIDISSYEYIRLDISDVDNSARVVLFGYDSPVPVRNVEVSFDENDSRRNIENVILLKDIRDELRKLNTYMEIITGEEL